jgi:uncharacterized membrane protein
VTFREAIENVGKAVDVVGVATLVIGILVATWAAARTPRNSTVDRYRLYRQRLGQAILLGLELLVAADIIRTVAVRPTLETAAVLAIIVVIRTALSFSLEVELEGRWPWARTRHEPATRHVS